MRKKTLRVHTEEKEKEKNEDKGTHNSASKIAEVEKEQDINKGKEKKNIEDKGT